MNIMAIDWKDNNFEGLMKEYKKIIMRVKFDKINKK
jgi:hypothetical protein